MPSLVNTLRRCHSTVRADRNSRAPISGLVRPSRASRAMCASCAVSSSWLGAALAHRLAGGRPAPGARARRTPPCRSRRACRGRCAAARARRAAGPRGAATPRRADARGPAPGAAGCGSAGRSPRDRGSSASAPWLTSARQRASMPSAKSLPRAASSPPAARAHHGRARARLCARPPRPARAAPTMEIHGFRVFEVACRAADAASL